MKHSAPPGRRRKGRVNEMKKRVMILTSSHMIGGFETLAGHFIHRLDKDRFDITALLLYPFYKAKHTPESVREAQKTGLYWEGTSIETVEIRMRSRYDLTAIWKTMRMMRRRRINALLFFALGAGTFLAPLAARLAGIPRVIRMSGTVFEGLYPAVLRPLDRFLLSWTDIVITPTHYLKSRFVHQLHTPSRKLKVIPHGIGFPSPVKKSRRRGLKQELGLPPASRVVGIVANLIPVKDHAGLIRSAPSILESVPDAYFMLVGDGPLKDELNHLSTELGVEDRIRFMGYRSDVGRLLGVMDVGVLCSRMEMFPMALLEMMAAEVPVVASRVGGIPELVEDGVSGLLVESGDTAALAGAVIRMLSAGEEVRAFVKAAKAAIGDKFTMEGMIRNTEDVLLSS